LFAVKETELTARARTLTAARRIAASDEIVSSGRSHNVSCWLLIALK
jgi:hypothetical protein